MCAYANYSFCLLFNIYTHTHTHIHTHTHMCVYSIKRRDKLIKFIHSVALNFFVPFTCPSSTSCVAQRIEGGKDSGLRYSMCNVLTFKSPTGPSKNGHRKEKGQSKIFFTLLSKTKEIRPHTLPVEKKIISYPVAKGKGRLPHRHREWDDRDDRVRPRPRRDRDVRTVPPEAGLCLFPPWIRRWEAASRAP